MFIFHLILHRKYLNPIVKSTQIKILHSFEKKVEFSHKIFIFIMRKKIVWIVILASFTGTCGGEFSEK